MHLLCWLRGPLRWDGVVMVCGEVSMSELRLCKEEGRLKISY